MTLLRLLRLLRLSCTRPMKAEERVVICDSKVAPELSAQQVQIVQQRQLPVQAIVDCSDPKHAELQVCGVVPAFPALCHRPTGKCYSGLCEADAHFAELARLEERPS